MSSVEVETGHHGRGAAVTIIEGNATDRVVDLLGFTVPKRNTSEQFNAKSD
jgi:hypothetical protein